MKKAIWKYSDSNIAGFSWSYSFWLARSLGGDYELSLKQSARGDARLEISPVTGMRDGVELYVALKQMVNETGSDSANIDVESVAEELRSFGGTLADQFASAVSVLEQREEEEWQQGEARIEVFKNTIAQYVAQFSDKRDCYYVGSRRYEYPSPREQMRRLLEDFVRRNGALPLGKQQINSGDSQTQEYVFPDEWGPQSAGDAQIGPSTD